MCSSRSRARRRIDAICRTRSCICSMRVTSRSKLTRARSRQRCSNSCSDCSTTSGLMNPPQIPERVLQFIAERIDTVPQLEALLLLWESSQRAWSEEELAGRIYVSRQIAAQTLQALQRQNLVIAESADAPRYRYNPQWDPSGEVMPE